MTKNKISIYIIILAAFSIFAVFILILQTSYNKVKSNEKTIIDKTFTSAFNPNLDTKIIELIKTRDTVLPEESPNYAVSTYVPPSDNKKTVIDSGVTVPDTTINKDQESIVNVASSSATSP